MAEQLVLDQRIGNCAAVDRYKRPAAPRPAIMNGPGGKFLARACLAFDEHRRIKRRHFVYQRLNGVKRFRLANHHSDSLAAL